MKKNVGIILIVVGALLLVLGYFSDLVLEDPLKDQNWFDIISWLIMVSGLVTHIVINKKEVA